AGMSGAARTVEAAYWSEYTYPCADGAHECGGEGLGGRQIGRYLDRHPIRGARRADHLGHPEDHAGSDPGAPTVPGWRLRPADLARRGHSGHDSLQHYEEAGEADPHA